jgi:hypothetical protein
MTDAEVAELVRLRGVVSDLVDALENFIKHQGAHERLALILQLEDILK